MRKKALVIKNLPWPDPYRFLNNTNIFMESRAGDIWDYTFMTGAGFGDPLERDPEKVREDVRDELVSIEGARRDYGVVFHPSTLQIDLEATNDLRKRHRKSN